MIHDLFSKRQKLVRGEAPDVYQYIDIPRELRVQAVYIMDDALGSDPYSHHREQTLELIEKTLRREYGWLSLGSRRENPYADFVNFLLTTKDYEKALDAIEIAFRVIDTVVRGDPYHFTQAGAQISPDDALNELNHRFHEHGVGYQFESGQIIRMDSQYIHSEVVKPVLDMLSGPLYKGANQEFLNAHEHYRNKRYKECLSECLKALESCMKSICMERKWPYDDNDTASRLIQILLDQELAPSFMQAHFTSLKSTLEAGVPTIRNKRSGHGQGPEEVIVPESLAAYALHLTASNILFLARANNELGRSGR